MLKVNLENISKRFIREWIFRDCSYTFQSGKSYALIGPNGSGKSSLAQVVSGFSTPTSGSIKYHLSDQDLPAEEVYKHLSYAAPYVEHIEEFTLAELLHFHFQLKKPVEGLSQNELIELFDLGRARDKEIRNFSSGMKQRLKVGLALTTISELIILDEPTTNMDENGVDWYLEMINRFGHEKLIIVCSNQIREYEFCSERLNLMDWK